MNLTQAMAIGGGFKPRKRVGRGTGSGHGKTSGRGHKGQRSRSGFTRKWGHEGGQMPLVRRLPKRGFSNARFRDGYEVVNVGDLARFPAGATVAPAELRSAGFISSALARVKILGDGDLKAALTVRAHGFSKSASGKIAAAGGRTEQVAWSPGQGAGKAASGSGQV